MITQQDMPAEIARARGALETHRLSVQTDPLTLTTSMMGLAKMLKATQ